MPVTVNANCSVYIITPDSSLFHSFFSFRRRFSMQKIAAAEVLPNRARYDILDSIYHSFAGELPERTKG